MFITLCNEIKYLIIKFAIFSDAKDVLRLRSVDLYFKFVVDEELFSVISNRPEKIVLFGRNYFSSVTRNIGDFLWWPRCNQYVFCWRLYTDIVEVDFSSFSEIYDGFFWHLLIYALPRTQMLSKIEEIFHPINEYSKRLSYCFSKWLTRPTNHFLPVVSSNFSWSCHLIFFGTGQDLPFMEPTLKTNYMINKDIFYSLLKPFKMQIVPYTTIYDFYPRLIHILFNPLVIETQL